MKKEIETTALITLSDLAKLGIDNAQEMLDEIFVEKDLCSGFSYLVESRYKTSSMLLRKFNYQVVEMAAGFSTHGINICKEVNNYIEIDLPKNSNLKRDIVTRKFSDRKIKFIAANIFLESTWNDINKHLESGPVTLFCEGFIQYCNKDERQYLFGKVANILESRGGVFFFEDSLRFHPEIDLLKDLSQTMSTVSKNQELLRKVSQVSLEQEIITHGFRICRVPVITDLTSEEMDESGKKLLSTFKFWLLERQ